MFALIEEGQPSALPLLLRNDAVLQLGYLCQS